MGPRFRRAGGDDLVRDINQDPFRMSEKAPWKALFIPLNL